MKKLSLILASLVLFAGVSFANPVVKKQAKQPATEKKATPKKEKKAPAKAKASKKTDKKASK